MRDRTRNGNLQKIGSRPIRTNQGLFAAMPKRTTLFRPVALAVLLSAGVALDWPTLEAQAQQQGARIKPGSLNSYRVPGPRVGGYSTTLSDVWGPAEMPPAPKDFGPHFDFPPESLNGPPLHDPYPN